MRLVIHAATYFGNQLVCLIVYVVCLLKLLKSSSLEANLVVLIVMTLIGILVYELFIEIIKCFLFVKAWKGCY